MQHTPLPLDVPEMAAYVRITGAPSELAEHLVDRLGTDRSIAVARAILATTDHVPAREVTTIARVRWRAPWYRRWTEPRVRLYSRPGDAAKKVAAMVELGYDVELSYAARAEWQLVTPAEFSLDFENGKNR